MAQLTITIPDAQAPRVLAAFAALHGYDPATGETQQDFMRRMLIAYLKTTVMRFEGQQAENAAIAAVATEITPT